jgi:hypothetical protein
MFIVHDICEMCVLTWFDHSSPTATLQRRARNKNRGGSKHAPAPADKPARL